MDRIEKQITLKAPRARVWKALADAQEFGKWFGVAIEGTFEPGKTAWGKISDGSRHDGLRFELQIEKVEPQRLLQYRWHPYAVDPKVDYSKEPMTTVTFELTDAGTGTKLTVTESGFDRIPLERRAKAFEMNGSGWAEQLLRIEKHVA